MHYLRLKKANKIAEKRFRKHNGFGFHNEKAWSEQKYINTEEWRRTAIGMLRKTNVFCSCPGCGNPRRHFGEKTVQELKADDVFNI